MATLAELRAEAKRQKRKGYSKLKKAELEKLLDTPPPKPPRGVPRKKPASQSVPVKQVQPAKKASSTRKSQIEEIEALLKKNPIKLSKEEKDLIKPPAKKAPAKEAPAKKAPAKKARASPVFNDAGEELHDRRSAKKILKHMLKPQTIKREVQDLIAKKGLSPKEAYERVEEAEKKMITEFWKKAYGSLGHIKMELRFHERDWEKWSEKNLAKFL